MQMAEANNATAEVEDSNDEDGDESYRAVNWTGAKPMAITQRDKRELDQLYSDYKDKYEGRKEDYFALLHLTKKFGIPVEQAANYVAFGGRDYAVDAYYIDREARNLYLFQFKWSEDHNLFKGSLERLASDGMDLIFGETTPDPDQNEVVHRLKADLFEHQSVIDRVLIHFVFKGDIDAVERSIGLVDRQEALESKRHLVRRFFQERPIELRIDFIADKPRPGTPPVQDRFELGFSQTVCRETPDDRRAMYLGFVPLIDLHRIQKTLGQRFLSRNIRSGLSDDNPPNRKIREALSDIILRGKTPPETFTFNHNGVTLAAEKLESRDGMAIVTVPRVLNGAQTLKSFARFIEESDAALGSEERQELLSKIIVVAKIVVDDPTGDFVTQVTISNNQQNPVEPWHLRANDRIQCDLQDRFAEQLGIFYSRQEHAFENMTWEELEGLEITDTKDIRIKPLAQTFLAGQGEIDRMSRLREVFEQQKWYDEGFRPSYLKCDPRRIILGYKAGLVLSPIMRRLGERASQWLSYGIGRARNLVWALLVQGMLNDEGYLPELLEHYGCDLRKAADFKEHLSNLAVNRAYVVLNSVLKKDEVYKSRIDEEKYSFLRTKELFRRCMEEAYDRYGWTKKSF